LAVAGTTAAATGATATCCSRSRHGNSHARQRLKGWRRQQPVRLELLQLAVEGRCCGPVAPLRLPLPLLLLLLLLLSMQLARRQLLQLLLHKRLLLLDTVDVVAAAHAAHLARSSTAIIRDPACGTSLRCSECGRAHHAGRHGPHLHGRRQRHHGQPLLQHVGQPRLLQGAGRPRAAGAAWADTRRLLLVLQEGCR
jgi:hypothetical protein